MPLLDKDSIINPVIPGKNAQDAPTEGEEPTADEQKMYDEFVTKGVGFISDERNDDLIVGILKQSEPLAKNIGQAASTVARMVHDSAAKSGVEIPPEVMMAGGEELVESLMDYSVSLGLIDKEDSKIQDTVDMAMLEAVKQYGETLLKGPDAGKLSAQAGDEFARGVAAEADAGTLNETFSRDQEALRGSPVARGVRDAMGGQGRG